MKNKLTLQEKATNFETFRHIERVRNLLNKCISELLSRGEKHDQSKLEDPEVGLFAEYTPKLAITTYGSSEYQECLKGLKPALDHHYANNRHHPEFNEFNEIWRDIIDFEDYYEVSNKGRVRSKSRINKRKKQGDINKKAKVMKPHLTPKGYLRIQLSKSGKTSNKFVHVLVGESFLGRESGKQINHKDGNKTNNYLKNLEWVTASENLKHAYDTNLRKPNVKHVVYCKELDILTFGCLKMKEELVKRGYKDISDSRIHYCINNEGSNSHLGLTFTSYSVQEYYEESRMIDDMNLIDLLEMICDWKAASERHNDGNIRKSIEINGKRFEMSPQLIRIFENTADVLFQ